MSGPRKKVIVISGASRGIGLELTRQSLDQGHQVIAGARNPKNSTELQALANESGGMLRVLELNVRSDSSVKSFAGALGVSHVDVLINNAGILTDAEYSLDDLPSEVVLESLDTNAVGPLRLTAALLHHLRKSSAACVANITSQMGSIGDNSSGGYYAYRMSKAALNMFTKSFSVDEPGIVALSLHPGWVQTRMGGPGATVTPEASAEGLLKIIFGATKKDSGRFYNYAGKELPY